MNKKETSQPFKINVLGLFTVETPIANITFGKILLLVIVIMAFILAMVFMLKWYAIPGLGLPAIGAKISKFAIGKIIKSRAP